MKHPTAFKREERVCSACSTRGFEIFVQAGHLSFSQIVPGHEDLREAELASAAIQDASLQAEAFLNLVEGGVAERGDVAAEDAVFDELLESAVLQAFRNIVLRHVRLVRSNRLSTRFNRFGDRQLFCGGHCSFLFREVSGMVPLKIASWVPNGDVSLTPFYERFRLLRYAISPERNC